ncbi:MAG TPA: sigma factor, partial [Ilumatobacteraceae bacterium]
MVRLLRRMDSSVEGQPRAVDHPTIDPVGEAWREHADELIRYATVLVGATDAEDLLVETFVRCTPPLRSDSVANTRGYLFRVLTNLAHDRGRRHGREVRRDIRLALGSDHSPSAGDWDPRIANAVA